jgi:hypothetical protein
MVSFQSQAVAFKDARGPVAFTELWKVSQILQRQKSCDLSTNAHRSGGWRYFTASFCLTEIRVVRDTRLTFLIGLLVTCSGRPIKNAKTLSNKTYSKVPPFLATVRISR